MGVGGEVAKEYQSSGKSESINPMFITTGITRFRPVKAVPFTSQMSVKKVFLHGIYTESTVDSRREERAKRPPRQKWHYSLHSWYRQLSIASSDGH